MSQIANNLFRFSREKASSARNVEKVSSEVLEDCADELVFKASANLYTESADDEDDEEFLDELEKELPDVDEDEAVEINRILDVEDEDIDIDDILGVVDEEECCNK